MASKNGDHAVSKENPYIPHPPEGTPYVRVFDHP
jgi:hypothetical protein